LLAVTQSGVEDDDAVIVDRAEIGVLDGHCLVRSLQVVVEVRAGG
jgi:hypothetical protein